jgi:predicted TIM-barrel enzyme
MGLSAKLQEKGGSDIICISPTSYCRLKGLGSLASFLPLWDVNQIIFDLSREILPIIKETPVISLSSPHNPLLPHREHLQKLRDMGISGVNPFISKIYGPGFGEQIEQIGMGWSNEVEFTKIAVEMNMFVFAYAFSGEEAKTLADAGAHIIASHVGSTIGGTIGAKTGMSLEQAAELSQEIFDAARKANKDVILFAHGGPIEGPKEVEYIFKNTNAQGFTGGSAAERMPIEQAILAVTRDYKNVPMK